MEDTRPFRFRLKPSIWKRFMLEVDKIHNNEYGSKQMEIELAFQNHIVNMRNRGDKGKAMEKHTHTLRRPADKIRDLKGDIKYYLVEELGKNENSEFTKREILDVIKLNEDLSDDRPAKDRFNLLERRGFFRKIGKSKGMTATYRLVDNKQSTITTVMAKSKEELEADLVLAKYGDLR